MSSCAMYMYSKAFFLRVPRIRSPKIPKSCWLQAPYTFFVWIFEFKMPFLCGNDGEDPKSFKEMASNEVLPANASTNSREKRKKS